MAEKPIDDLKRSIEAREAIAIIGAGVSAAATENTPCATWPGLLRDGCAHCVNVIPGLPKGWADRIQGELESGDLDELLSAAEKISRKLGAPEGGEFAAWLETSVGQLPRKQPRILHALDKLQIPLLTTNYDTLLEQATGRAGHTWQDISQSERILRGSDSAVLHLHGVWNRPESVILGIRSYEEIRKHDHIQALLQAQRATKCLLFIGCGAGLQDPNFGALLAWARKVFASAPYRHYRLACDREYDAVCAQHVPDDRIHVLPYGADFDALPGFLESLAPPAKPKPASSYTLPSNTAAFLHDYRDRLRALHGYWNLRYIGVTQAGGAGAPLEAGLEDMYLPLRLAEAYDINELDLGIAVSPEEVLRRKKPLVVRGPAGCGKTTWMRYTFRRLLDNEDAFPVMIELRRLVREWTREGIGPGNRSLDAYIERWVSDHAQNGHEGELRALLEAPNGPRPVLFVDGWDETGDLGDELRAKLAGFMNTHPRALVVVSSRPYGEGRPSHSDGFEELNVQPLSDPEIRQFAANFFTQCYRDDRIPATEALDEFMAALDRAPEAAALARTALLLTMMLVISRSSPLPDKRHKLYKQCIDSLLTAIPDRYIKEGVREGRFHWHPPNSDEPLRAVAALASQMQDRGYQSQRRQAIVTAWEDAEKLLPATWEEHQRTGFLAWLAERAGLLVDRADGTLAFAHLSFQEFLTAWHLKANIADADRIEVFKAKSKNTNWWETLRLWAALLEAENPGRLREVLDAMMKQEDGVRMAGTIFADGLGEEAAFQTWRGCMIAQLTRTWPYRIDPCIQAWAASRQTGRRAALEHDLIAEAPALHWAARIRFKEFASDALSITLPPAKPDTHAAAISQYLEQRELDEAGIAAGRILCGGPALWPDGEVGLLNVWPGHRRLAGLRLQSLANLRNTRNTIVAAARTTIPAAPLDKTQRDFARDFARYFARGVFPGHPDLIESCWIQDFALSELYSLGRAMPVSVLAYAKELPDAPPAQVLAAACRLHYGRAKQGPSLSKCLKAYPPDADPLWPALARHIAGHPGKLANHRNADIALLEDLVQHPERREPPLRWGLQYIVRGDVMLEDGTVLTLDELAAEAGVQAPPFLEPMPERVEVDWNAEESK